MTEVVINDTKQFHGVAGLSGYSYTGGAGYKMAQNTLGAWSSVAADVPGETGLGYGCWEARTNSIRNPTGLGAAVGLPGTNPTNWSTGLPVGISKEIVALGVENGLPFVDIRLFGTNTSGGEAYPTITFETGNQIAAVNGQTWTAIIGHKLVGGSLTNLVGGTLIVSENNSSGGVLVQGGVVISPTAVYQRSAYTRTLSNASVAFVHPKAAWTVAANASIDATIRFYAPNLKQGVDINDPPILQTNNLAATRTADTMNRAMPLPDGDFDIDVVWKNSQTPPAIIRPFEFHDGSESNRLFLMQRTDGLLEAYVGIAAVDTRIGALSSAYLGARTISASIKRRGGNWQFWIDGVKVGADTAAGLPVVTTLGLGFRRNNTQYLNGHLLSLSILKK